MLIPSRTGNGLKGSAGAMVGVLYPTCCFVPRRVPLLATRNPGVQVGRNLGPTVFLDYVFAIASGRLGPVHRTVGLRKHGCERNGP
jgi:hypothetical protein